MLNDDHQPFLIRGYRASDRQAVRKLCCETGFLGEPIDPVYQDRELFADFLTTYYTDHEPESCFLLEVDGEISGYLLGSRKPLQNQLYALYQNVWLFFRALTRYFRYNQRSRRFIRWLLMYGWREVPARPRRVPHFHINLLPEARKVSTTRALMSAYLSYLYRSGEKRVCGQIVILMQQLHREFHLTYLFISHSLPVVRYLSTRIAVMYRGKLVETGTAEEITSSPQHEYTRSLLTATPELKA